MRTDRIPFLDVGFDTLALEELVERLAQITGEDRFGYVVTPNVDHIVRLHNGSAAAALLAPIYAAADYCLCDSRVLARLARLCGINLPVIPGSDLTETIFARVLRDGDRVAVVGGNEELLDALQMQFPNVEFVQHVPPMGLAKDAAARRRAASFIARQKARFTFICVGSPQQEMIAAEAARLRGSRGLALCVGASLEFIAGHELRAPLLVRRIGIEWAHRLVMNPRRMWKRYLVEGPRIFALTYSWVHKRQ
jgi:exopolysaccharide biosynthesis WecB/TagA/CpsF family protein